MPGKSSVSLVTATMLALSCLIPQASAFWRLPCAGPVSVERADPVVDNGQVSGHLHTIMGGNGFDFSMDYAKARSSTCSTCSVKQDLSNYWIPTLFYQAQNGSFFPVRQNGGALIYYLQRPDPPNERIVAFPEGFRMIAGDPYLRSYSNTLEQRAISYACIDYQTGGGPELPGFPQRNCANGWRLQVFFPSCWNGRDVDSPDHKSHMAYPDNVNTGKCPSSHPVRTMSIFYEILYEVADFKDMWYKGTTPPFVLSNGDPTGYGLHGDFVNGWDINVLQAAANDCRDESGVIEKCRHFQYFSDDTQKDCFNPPRVNEQTEGWMDKLPGCNPVQPGPGRAVKVTNCGATTTIGTPKTYFSDMSSKGWTYVGCALDNLNARLLPERMASRDMTIEKCIDYCVSKGFVYAGLQYAEECFCGNNPVPASSLGSKCQTPCAGNTKQVCGGPIRLSVYKKTGARRARRSISA